MKAIRVALFALAFASSIHSSAVGAEESIDDHTLILLVGPAMEKNTVDGSKAYGTSLAVEFTAIEHQLDIEVGTQYLSTPNPKELGAQIIFKKPFELASDIELGVNQELPSSQILCFGQQRKLDGISVLVIPMAQVVVPKG